jgi:hypothetical protein
MREDASVRPSMMPAVLVALLALSGCAPQHEIVTAPAPAPSVPTRVETEEPPAVDAEPLPVPTRKPDTLASRTDLDPERLIGLSTLQTESMLGIPALQDERPPAKVWTYNAKACVLNIFFYPDINTRVFQALTYEFNEEVKTDAAKRRCLEELVREHAG